MSDVWVDLDAVDLSGIEDRAENITSALDTVSTFFRITAAVLRGIALLLGVSSNPLVTLINGLISVLESFILDFLQNNVAVAVHVNLNWDKNWEFRNKADGVIDYINDGALPYSGNGLTGWFADLSVSTRDQTDPFRPLSDDDTEVGGFVILNGVATINELSSLQRLVQAWIDLPNFSTLRDDDEADTEIKLSLLEANKEVLGRLGPAVFDDFMLSVVGNPEDEASALLERLGITGSIDGFSPQPGNYPKWASVPFASLVPPLKTLMDLLRALADNLRMGTGTGDMLERLAEMLAKRAELLAEMAEQLQGIIATIVSILAALTGVKMIYLTKEAGGTDGFFTRALSADNIPDFGPRGIVAGVVAISTSDEVAGHFGAFFDALGYDLEALVANTTTRELQISDAYDDIF